MATDITKEMTDVILAAKRMHDRLGEEGLIDREKIRYSIMAREDRKAATKELAVRGMSSRQIAQITGASQRTAARDAAEPNGSNAEPNGSPNEVSELLTKLATDLYQERNLEARLKKLRFRLGGALLELKERVEASGRDWWEFLGEGRLPCNRRDAQRLITGTQKEK